jgi:hypothetical protein
MAVDLEGAKDAIKTQLLSHEFADTLIGIFEEKQEEAPTEIFNEVYTVLKWSPQNYPNAQMGPARGVNRNPEGYGMCDLEYEFTVYVEVTDTDEERLQRIVERYVRAVQDFYKVRPNLLVEQINCSLWTGDEDYSPLINQGDGKPFIQAGAVTFFLRMQR